MTKSFASYLGLEPTQGQTEFFHKFERFLYETDSFSAFILRGYAGTGKTSTLKAVVQYLKANKFKSVLLAPTGRAAKVLSNYTQTSASTIHKKIYRRKSSVEVLSAFTLNENKHSNTIFIVDESSMISGTLHDPTGMYYAKGSLLDDLVEYVYSNTNNCRLLLVGDTAQLPPVGSDFSPALNKEMMFSKYGLKIIEHELREVMRQEQNSGILMNATSIRNQIEENDILWPQMRSKGYKDFYAINGEQLSEGIQYAYDKFGMDETLIVCRSNKNANKYNQEIRSRILFREEEISAGDYLMVVKNNYFWLSDEDESGFIANGEIVRVVKVKREEEMHGFRFMNLTVEMVDLPNQPKLDVKVLVDTLYTDGPSLSTEDQKKLYDSVSADYQDYRTKKERYEKMKSDPYYNALQVKFAYAVTCHKAQGGQWKAVFIEQGYLLDEMLNLDLLRWLYTAITRASEQVFLVNFHPKFFKNT